MEGTEWSDRMKAALEALKARLQEQELPRLGQSVAAFRAAYENLHQLLVRKGLILEDLYRYEGRPAKLAAPPDDAILESQKREQCSVRLAAFRAQLELLVGTLEPSLDSLSLSGLRPVADLARYVRWSRLSTTSESPVTCCVAEHIGRIRAGADPLSAQVASTSVSQLDRLSREILATLERVAAWQREQYKAGLRGEVLPAVGRGSTDEETVEKARRHFASALRTRPFFPHLLREVLAEDSPEGGEARSRALARVAGCGREPGSRPPADERESLIQAMRTLAAAALPLADCAAKIEANAREAGGSRPVRGLAALMRRFARAKPKGASYRVEYLDGAVMRAETLELAAFLDQVRRQSRVLAALGRPEGATAARLQKASSRSLVELLDRQAGELQVSCRRLAGLSELLRKQAAADVPLKGIRIELTLLKNSLIRAGQLRREYAASSERAQRERSGNRSPQVP